MREPRCASQPISDDLSSGEDNNRIELRVEGRIMEQLPIVYSSNQTDKRPPAAIGTVSYPTDMKVKFTWATPASTIIPTEYTLPEVSMLATGIMETASICTTTAFTQEAMHSVQPAMT